MELALPLMYRTSLFFPQKFEQKLHIIYGEIQYISAEKSPAIVNENNLCHIYIIWQPRGLGWNAHV